MWPPLGLLESLLQHPGGPGVGTKDLHQLLHQVLPGLAQVVALKGI